MERVILTDPAITPNDELIFSIIGNKRVLWQNIMDYLHGNYKDISEVWRFYNDGKCWLFRTLTKKKTVFWVGVIEGTFRVSLSFSDKTEPVFMQSNLPESIKEEFRTAKKFNVTRSITVTMKDSTDVENVIKMIELKMKIL